MLRYEKPRDVEDRFEDKGRNDKFDSRLLSYFTRLQYDYKGKYLLSLQYSVEMVLQSLVQRIQVWIFSIRLPLAG